MADLALPGPGDTLVEKYQLLREVGRGGTGVVMEANDLRLGRRVAIKMISPGVWQTPELVARFEREARAVARLRSPHSVRLHDVDVGPAGLPVMVMEYLEGRGLDAELDERGPLPVGEAVGYVWQACQAMAEAHAAGIVHRDLKPSNLFLCAEGGRRVLKVLDFGISKSTDERHGRLTQTGTALGTPEYMSPEQVRALPSIDGRSDVWSLGIVLYQLLGGTTPFAGETATAVVAAIVTNAVRPLRELRPEVSPELEAVVMKALRKRPGDRYPTADAFAQALSAFLAGGEGADADAGAGGASASEAPTAKLGHGPEARRGRRARRFGLGALALFGAAGVAAVGPLAGEPAELAGADAPPSVEPTRVAKPVVPSPPAVPPAAAAAPRANPVASAGPAGGDIAPAHGRPKRPAGRAAFAAESPDAARAPAGRVPPAGRGKNAPSGENPYRL